MSKRLEREVKRDQERWRAQRAAQTPGAPAPGVGGTTTGTATTGAATKSTTTKSPAPGGALAARVPRDVVPPHGLRVGESPGKGRGVFATRPIAAGEVVEVAPVIVVPPDEQKVIDGTLLESYLFLWRDTVALALGLGALYNHAWDPNMEYRKRFDEQVIEFVALRDIAPGEELVTNYTASAPERAGLWSYLS